MEEPEDVSAGVNQRVVFIVGGDDPVRGRRHD